jgi:hypothetical protein
MYSKERWMVEDAESPMVWVAAGLVGQGHHWEIIGVFPSRESAQLGVLEYLQDDWRDREDGDGSARLVLRDDFTVYPFRLGEIAPVALQDK